METESLYPVFYGGKAHLVGLFYAEKNRKT